MRPASSVRQKFGQTTRGAIDPQAGSTRLVDRVNVWTYTALHGHSHFYTGTWKGCEASLNVEAFKRSDCIKEQEKKPPVLAEDLSNWASSKSKHSAARASSRIDLR